MRIQESECEFVCEGTKKYQLGTALEIATSIVIEMAKEVDNAKFPMFSFAIASDRSDLQSDALIDIAEMSEGWYGVEAVDTSFTRGGKDVVTLIGDYWGGGCAVAGTLWMDELYDTKYAADCIKTVILRTIEMQESVNEDTVFIAEFEDVKVRRRMR